MECEHKNWIQIYPVDTYIHREDMPKDIMYVIRTIRIRICKDCNSIIKVEDFGE